MIPTHPFGSTGHESTRILFGAAALAVMRQDRADATLEMLLEYGVNHIDTAAGYGASEERLRPFLAQHRDAFFLATKTRERTRETAREGLHRSLERMGVDRVDMIQLHNLVEEDEWQTALGPDGALEALIEARDEGLVRFIGVTGHGTRIAAMHARSLERFAFDSVLLPCNHTMLVQPDYARDFDALVATCVARGIAVQTIKSIARRRWQEDYTGPRFSWYEPLRDTEAIRRAVHFVLARPGLFLNTSSDAALLRATLDAASAQPEAPAADSLERDAEAFAIQPLFGEGMSETI